MASKKNFWEVKTLSEMSKKEWESLCDGCGRCCLNKFEDEDTGKIEYTDVGCYMLDCKSATCKNYKDRSTIVDDCITLTPNNLEELSATIQYNVGNAHKHCPDGVKTCASLLTY